MPGPLITNAGGTTQAVVSVPPAAGNPHAYLFNSGNQPVWLGGAGVSTATGFQLPPNNRIDLSNAAGTIWAIAGGNTSSPSGTATSATVAAGTAILGSYGTAAPYTAGMTIIIEQGSPRQEITSVASSNAGTVVTAPAMVFAHGSGAIFQQWTPLLTTLQVTCGAT